MDLNGKTVVELRGIAKELGMRGCSSMKKEELLEAIICEQRKQAEEQEALRLEMQKQQEEESQEERMARTQPQRTETSIQEGILEVLPEGFGFLRGKNYLSTSEDIYMSPVNIRRFGLRTGDYLKGIVRERRENEKFRAMIYVKEINGCSPEGFNRRIPFEYLTPIYPQQRLKLETGEKDYAMRLLDLIAPIGKGQRGMIVAPPKAGKTTLLKAIARSISANHPECQLIVLLVDERPEEVTDMQRSIRGEVIYSTFDQEPEHHIKVAQMVMERAMRLVESRQDVVILMDSITRLARAYNLVIPPTGRTLTGGMDAGALMFPKRFFGAARNIEHGGSLTILATALVETGSRMDDVIFEEFKGTGNMEVYLNRRLQERGIFPAIDIARSGTRRDDLLLDEEQRQALWYIRRSLASANGWENTEQLIQQLTHTHSNRELVQQLLKSP